MRLLATALLSVQCGRLAVPTGVLYDYDYLYDGASMNTVSMCMAACRGDIDALRDVSVFPDVSCSGGRTLEQLALEMGHADADE